MRILLPRSAGAPVTTRPPTASDLPRGTETVLVVDDEPALLDVAEMMLRDLGYRVLTARDAREALDLVTAGAGEQVDPLFSDVITPGGINGFDLARRARIGRPDLPVLLASGFTGKLIEDRVGTDLLGAILSKPYDMSALARAGRNALDRAGPGRGTAGKYGRPRATDLTAAPFRSGPGVEGRVPAALRRRSRFATSSP